MPENWKAVAWIDADLEFDNPRWATDCLCILNTTDIVQLFSNAVDQDPKGNAGEFVQSAMSQFVHKKIRGNGLHFYYPGYAWAANALYMYQV